MVFEHKSWPARALAVEVSRLSRLCRGGVEVCVEVCQGLSRLTPCGSGVEVLANLQVRNGRGMPRPRPGAAAAGDDAPCNAGMHDGALMSSSGRQLQTNPDHTGQSLRTSRNVANSGSHLLLALRPSDLRPGMGGWRTHTKPWSHSAAAATGYLRRVDEAS